MSNLPTTHRLAADDAYVQAKTNLVKATEDQNGCTLAPFLRVREQNTLTGEPSQSAFALFHYGLLQMMDYHAYDTPAASVDAGEASLHGMVVAAGVFMSHPSRDGWTTEQRDNYVKAMITVIHAAHAAAQARIADEKGGAA